MIEAKGFDLDDGLARERRGFGYVLDDVGILGGTILLDDDSPHGSGEFFVIIENGKGNLWGYCEFFLIIEDDKGNL
jgi:hypothetical protein